MADPGEQEIIRFYNFTKYPKMFGRFAEGTKILGGPYTAVQAGVGALMLIGSVATWRLWANYGLIGNLIILAMVVLMPTYLAGKLRTKSRNPFYLLLGGLRAGTAPGMGKMRDKPAKILKPHQAISSVAIDFGYSGRTHTEVTAAPETNTKQPSTPTRTPTPAAPVRSVTAIERLMAQASSKS